MREITNLKLQNSNKLQIPKFKTNKLATETQPPASPSCIALRAGSHRGLRPGGRAQRKVVFKRQERNKQDCRIDMMRKRKIFPFSRNDISCLLHFLTLVFFVSWCLRGSFLVFECWVLIFGAYLLFDACNLEFPDSLLWSGLFGLGE